MLRPDSSEPRQAFGEPHPVDATQYQQRPFQPPALQHSHISLDSHSDTPVALEIERMLEQVLEQVRLATSATAAAVALVSGDGLVCRAAVGPNAPDVGVHLDVNSGLSGACVRSREAQHCADTETDPRVNSAASRRLQVRSLLVVPLLDGDQLLGLFEIFSPHPAAFGTRDLENLQTLAQVIVANLRDFHAAPASIPEEVIESPDVVTPVPPVNLPVSDPQPVVVADEPAASSQRISWATPVLPTNGDQATAPEEISAAAEISVLREAPAPPDTAIPKAVRQKRSRDWGTSLLTGAVITVAVILGWTVGRPRFENSASSKKQTAGIVSTNMPDSEDARDSSAKRADPEAVDPVDESAKPGSGPKVKVSHDNSAGGLVIYQNGKIIFRQAMRAGPAGHASAKFEGVRPADVTEKVATIFLAPQMASARLLQRIEPLYPESALERRIQGEVELEALVGKDGSVEQLKLISGDPQLASAAADAVRRWRFRPYQSDGRDVEFSTRLTVNFRLH